MQAHEPIDPELLLANTGFVRSLARSLLSDEHAVDDVVQETWLSALSQRSRPRSSLPGWLAGVSRHLALGVVRRRERRLRRERTAARPEAIPSAADVAERWELMRVVVAAVEELEEPYRMTLLLRYFEDLGPTEIALRLRVPLETVRTRLRRGLEKLRTRLDQDHAGARGPWRLALAPLAGPLAGGAPAAAIPTMASLLVAACIMTLKSKVVVGAALLIALTASVYVAAGGMPAADPTDRAPDSAAHATASGTPPPSEAPAADATRAPVSEPVAAATPTPVVIQGRCVDEHQTPLPGCEVALRGAALAHVGPSPQAPTQWQSPEPQLTGADGTFRVTLVPPAAFFFILDVSHENHCPLQGRWSELRPGQQVDLGDVVLRTGARVRGKVTDTAGAPGSPARITLSLPAERTEGSLAPRMDRAAQSGEDGSFEFRYPLGPGRWSVKVSGKEELVRPGDLIVLEGERLVALEVVVRRPDPAAVLSGTVLDETGAPVAGVTLDAWPMDADTSGRPTLSKEDGSFVLRRRGDSAEPVRIVSSNHEEFDRLEDERTFTWGTAEIRLTLRRAPGLHLLVVDAETGKPVEDFGVRCLPLQGPRDSRQTKTRLAGRHRDGRLRVPEIAIGKNLLIVFPEDPGLLPSEPITFERTEAGTPPLRVALHHPVELAVRLVFSDGRPVAGATLQLVRAWGEKPLILDAIVTRTEDAFHGTTGDPMAILSSEAKTDAQGRAALSGPASGELAIRGPGPGHVPFLRERVVLAKDSAELEIVVAAGGTLRGRVKPAAAVLARLVPPVKRREQFVPGLRLKSVGGQPQHFPPFFEERCRIEGDGTFSISGVPPGSWEIGLEWWMQLMGLGVTRRFSPLLVVRDLAEGETRELELDAGGLLPGRLEGQVLLDGNPCARSTIFLHRALPDGRGGKTLSGGLSHTTDGEGRFQIDLNPAFYQLSLLPGTPGGPEVELRSAGWVLLEPNSEVRRVFDLMHRRAKVRIFASDGVTPVRARTFIAEGEDFIHRAETDEEGTLRIDPAPPGPFRIFTWPPGFDEGRMRMLHTTTEEALEQLRIVLGTVQLPSGAKDAIFELTMPAEKR